MQKKEKRKRRGTLSLFVPLPICRLIDVDALDPEFPPMDLMDSDALAGNGSNAIWRDWRDTVDGLLGGGPLDPFYLHAFIRTILARTFDARKQLTD